MRGSRQTGRTREDYQAMKRRHPEPKVPGCHVRACTSLRCLFALLSLAGTAWGYGNPTVGNPVGSGTMPPGGYGNGLISTPNPIDTSNNQVITGNVGGGKHFRGSIPYNSVTSFGAPLGSTRLDSFLRYSAVPDGTGERPNDYSAFHSPTGTVVTTRPGYSGVFTPVSPMIAGTLPQSRAGQPADIMAWAEVAQPQVSTGETSPTRDPGAGAWQRSPAWPISKTPEEMRRIIAGEPGNRLTDEPLGRPRSELMAAEDYQRELEQLQRDFEKVKADASELEQSLRADAPPPDGAVAARGLSGPAATPGVPGLEVQSRPVPTPPNEGSLQRSQLFSRPAVLPQRQDQDASRLPDVVPLAGQEQAADRLAETRLDFSNQPVSPGQPPSGPSTPMDRIDAIFRTQVPEQAGGGSEQNAGELPAMRRVQETARTFDAPSKFLAQPLPGQTGGGASSPGQVPSPLDRLRTTSDSKDAAPSPSEEDSGRPQPDAPKPLLGDSVLEKYENASPLAQERFDRYMKAAELYFQRDQYYRAAESFTLASMYKPADARAYLGKGHALLAAGEYVSSAVFLARAIELDAQRTLGRSDLVETLGGPDAFVERINDLERCAEAGASPQLHFLLAYVNYQMGRPAEAQTALAAAEKGLPPALAIDLLKAALGR